MFSVHISDIAIITVVNVDYCGYVLKILSLILVYSSENMHWSSNEKSRNAKICL